MSVDDTATMKPCGLGCPRCNCGLVEHEPSALWLRWFECIACFSAWHFINGGLHAGKMRRPLGGG